VVGLTRRVWCLVFYLGYRPDVLSTRSCVSALVHRRLVQGNNLPRGGTDEREYEVEYLIMIMSSIQAGHRRETGVR
jgi:hypothetical protein